MECLFCKIVSGEIPAKKVFEDGEAIAFHDLHPQAPLHMLIISRKHIASLAQAHAIGGEGPLLGHLLNVASQIADTQNLSCGYRVVINNGPDGGQTVDHLHLHLLGGRAMEWPPG